MAFKEKRKVPHLDGVSPVYCKVDVEKTNPDTGEITHVKEFRLVNSGGADPAESMQLIEQLNSGMRIKKIDSKIDSNDRIDLPEQLFTKPAEDTAPY